MDEATNQHFSPGFSYPTNYSNFPIIIADILDFFKQFITKLQI